MIKIQRQQPAPPTLVAAKVIKAKQAIRRIANRRKPLSADFEKRSYWRDPDVRDLLWAMQHHKCYLCERRRDKMRESDIDHFRPKAEVYGADPSHKGYWWLAYEWDNLFFSCRRCNQEYKKTFFPISDSSKRAYSPTCSLSAEGSLLIDPTKLNPEDHIGFDWISSKSGNVTLAFARGRSQLGTKTIEVAGLNEGELPLDRGDLVLELEAIADLMIVATYTGADTTKIKATIYAATSAALEFTAFRRDFFKKRGFQDCISHDPL